jgi:hypothetical protein
MTPFTADTLASLLPSSAQLKAFCRTAAQRDYGRDLERLCRGLAIAIAFSYACGYAFGCWLHQTNEQLSGFARQFSEPQWHQQRLTALKARLAASRCAVHETSTGDPQPALPLTSAPQAPAAAEPAVVLRTRRSKPPKPAPKPSRQRRAKGSSRTTAPATA